MANPPAGFSWLRNAIKNPVDFTLVPQGLGSVIDNSMVRAGTDQAIPCVCLCVWINPTLNNAEVYIAHIDSSVMPNQVNLPALQNLTTNTITNLLAGWVVDPAYNKTYFCCGGANLPDSLVISQAIVAGIDAALTNNNIQARQPWATTQLLKDATGFIMPLDAAARNLNPMLVLYKNNLENMGWTGKPVVQQGDPWTLRVDGNMQPFWA